jgi:hypothetical protein
MKLKFILFALISSTFILFAQNSFKKYKHKSGIVFYDVKISSFDNNLNNQVRGIARLVFDDWGAKELQEEDVEEIQEGDFNDTRSKHTLTKVDYGTIYTADYDENVTYKTRDRDLDLAITQKLDLTNEGINSLKKAGAKIVGKEKIAGLECDVWELNDQQLCIYDNGIPLKIVVQNAGFLSEKKAVQVILDKPIPPKEFALPPFKIVEDEGYSNNQSSLVRAQDYLKSIKDLREELDKKGVDLNDKNLTVTPDLEKDIINILGKRYLAKQKKYLPDLIKALEAEKECVAKAKDAAEAKKCIEPVREINNKLGDKTFEFKDIQKLDSKTKEMILDRISQEIKDTKVTALCVSKNNKTTDVIICTEGKLKPEVAPEANTTPAQAQ